MTFNKIIAQYGKVYKLGKKIIKHKHIINNMPQSKIQQEFYKQEQRIHKFIKLTNDANARWKKNNSSINEYWTGY